MDGKIINPIGCHVSIAGGVSNAPGNARSLECETFQIFTRSPHGGAIPKLTSDIIADFSTQMKEQQFSSFVVHAPYIINFGSENPKTFHGSIQIIRSELERSSQLGAQYLMFHPGSIKGELKEGLDQVRKGLREVLDGYNGLTKLLVEISAGAGNVIGDSFEEIEQIIKPLKKKPGFGGVCFDTQHAFGSGYDLRTAQAVKKTFTEFDRIIGLRWLRMCHFNDSKVELGSHKDRHEHIGQGRIGEKGFLEMFKFFAANQIDIPLILETEHDTVDADIKLLKTLRNKVIKQKGRL